MRGQGRAPASPGVDPAGQTGREGLGAPGHGHHGRPAVTAWPAQVRGPSPASMDGGQLPAGPALSASRARGRRWGRSPRPAAGRASTRRPVPLGPHVPAGSGPRPQATPDVRPPAPAPRPIRRPPARPALPAADQPGLRGPIPLPASLSPVLFPSPPPQLPRVPTHGPGRRRNPGPSPLRLPERRWRRAQRRLRRGLQREEPGEPRSRGRGGADGGGADPPRHCAPGPASSAQGPPRTPPGRGRGPGPGPPAPGPRPAPQQRAHLAAPLSARGGRACPAACAGSRECLRAPRAGSAGLTCAPRVRAQGHACRPLAPASQLEIPPA